jgi:formyltetrahydrofolate deformylase
MRSRLVVSCPDRPGIVAAVATFLFEQGANILSSAQHSGAERFFLRMEFEHAEPLGDLVEIAARFGMSYTVRDVSVPRLMAVLVSREEHCLLDLLWRARAHEFEAEITTVISNHDRAREAVTALTVPFCHIPNTRDVRESAEAETLRGVDLVVLARYMQILSGDFLARLGVPVINIHHSFLPAFAGAEPYERAHARGVKIIGATAHYVTEELDAGPIIEQDVQRVSHQDDVEALRRTGRDIERTVLARAVRWHLEDRVLVDGPRTIVF